MAITTLKAVKLKNAGLTDLFADNHEHWKEMAKRAKDYVAEFINPRSDIHPDDLIPILVPRLELDPKLRVEVDKEKLPQNRITWFGEYIVDEVWAEI
jgi:hypothetical protein